MSNKIGFWSVFAIVIGSQVGSGVLVLPASLAPYSTYSLLGWGISGGGAICLALVFASLCKRFPRTGGPHVYVGHAFGNIFSFFTGWTYWLISWVSSTAVVVASIGYLSPFIGDVSPYIYLLLELLLLFAIAVLNSRGVQAAGNAEFVLSLLKLIPLLFLPIAAMKAFSWENFALASNYATESSVTILGKVTLLTLWGFIGVEAATTPAGSVENPSKTIPSAIIIGTSCVALLYLVNSIGIMGVLPGAVLAQSNAPYVDAAQVVFAGQWHLGISFIASLICIGTLNAWMLTSGQIALGLAEDKMLPRIFAQRNQFDAPRNAVVISTTGVSVLLLFTVNESLSTQITEIIDISVVAFLFVYLISSVGLLKILWQEGYSNMREYLFTILAILFCIWVIYETSFSTLMISTLFVMSGVPVYFLWYKRR